MLKIEKLKILILGSDKSVLKGLASSIEVFQMAIEVRDKVDHLANDIFDYDLILLDVTLANSDKSFEVLNFIKNKNLFSPKVFFIFSNNANCFRKSFQHGADGCYDSPLDVTSIRTMLLKGNNEKSILWGIPFRQEAQICLRQEVESLDYNKEVRFGRGGLSLCHDSSQLFKKSDIVDFDFTLKKENIKLNGKGTVMWNSDSRYGLEIKHLSDDCRSLYIKWLNEFKPTAYIPE